MRALHEDPNARELASVARGELPADCYIEAAQVLDVVNGDLLHDVGVAIKGRYIAYVGPSRAMIGPQTDVIDATTQVLAPAFIDAHAHAELMLNPVAFAAAVVGTGTTTVLSDTSDTCIAFGERALPALFALALRLPLRMYFALPSSSPPYPSVDGPDVFPLPALERWLSNRRVLALSEITPWPRLLEDDPDLFAKIEIARQFGKRIEGHTAGANAERLAALKAAGLTSCHESVSAEEVRTKLRLGYFVMVRHGSLRSDLAACVEALTDPRVDTRSLALTPDGVMPDQLLKRGYMDAVVRDAIALGVPPLLAYRMATLNPATYLGLDRVLGAITPGRLADLVFLNDLWEVRPQRVMVNGRTVAEQGALTVPVPGLPRELTVRMRQFSADDLRHPGNVGPQTFWVAAAGDGDAASETVPVIQAVDGTITRRKDMPLPCENGLLRLPATGDLMKASVPRRDGSGFVTGFISGYGSYGGIVNTMPFGAARPLVIGRNEADMAIAYAHAMAIGGGLVYVENGRVIATLPLRYGGLQSEESAAEVAQQLLAFKQATDAAGERPGDIVVMTRFLTFSSLPFIRLTQAGVIDVKTRQVLYQGGPPRERKVRM